MALVAGQTWSIVTKTPEVNGVGYAEYYFQEYYDVEGNYSQIYLTNLTVVHSTGGGEFVATVNSTITYDGGTPLFGTVPEYKGYCDKSPLTYGAGKFPLISEPIYHNSDGTKSITITAQAHELYISWGFSWPTDAASKTITLQPLHVHSYTNIVTAPTCTTQGFTNHICACGANYTDTYVDALGHNYTTQTCITPEMCTRCGVITKESLGHTWVNGVVAVAPTYTTTGTKQHTCSVCGATKSELIKRLCLQKKLVPTVRINGITYIPHIKRGSEWSANVPNIHNGTNFESY